MIDVDNQLAFGGCRRDDEKYVYKVMLNIIMFHVLSVSDLIFLVVV